MRWYLLSDADVGPAVAVPLPLHRVPETVLVGFRNKRDFPRQRAFSPLRGTQVQARVLDEAS